MSFIRLIRHGQSASNAGEVTTCPDTIPLTALGKAQAALVASCFAASPQLTVSSAFDRARQTAAPLCARFPDMPVDVWPVQEFTYLAPRRYKGTTRTDRAEAVHAYWQRLDPLFCDGEGAESFVTFWARVEAFLERLHTVTGSVAVFTHGQFLRGVMLRVVDGPMRPEAAMPCFRDFRTAIHYPNAAMCALAVSPRHTLLGQVSTAHLPPEMLST